MWQNWVKHWVKNWGIVQLNLNVNSDFLDDLTKLLSECVKKSQSSKNYSIFMIFQNILFPLIDMYKIHDSD